MTAHGDELLVRVRDAQRLIALPASVAGRPVAAVRLADGVLVDRVRAVKPASLPPRVVSLVPSLTEALFSLGLASHLVGVTDWCVHPAEAVAKLPKLGGTKTPSIPRILALAPDLVIANHEENRRRDVERLEAAGVAGLGDLPAQRARTAWRCCASWRRSARLRRARGAWWIRSRRPSPRRRRPVPRAACASSARSGRRRG